jgi:hypothetical protein
MAKFIKESDICKGSGSGVNPSGITGNGPNSTAVAKGVRAGCGIWREDLRMTYYKIKQLQGLLNIAKNEYGEMMCLST